MPAQRLRLLSDAKARAVATEDYVTAKKIKAVEGELKTLGAQLAQLDMAKRVAVADEDYDKAKEIKDEVDSLKNEIEQKVRRPEPPVKRPPPPTPPPPSPASSSRLSTTDPGDPDPRGDRRPPRPADSAATGAAQAPLPGRAHGQVRGTI